MANGQVVLITTEQLGERPVTRTVYYVAEEDPVKATALIAAVMAPNETVVAYGPLPDAAVKAMGLRPVSSGEQDKMPPDPNHLVPAAAKATS